VRTVDVRDRPRGGPRHPSGEVTELLDRHLHLARPGGRVRERERMLPGPPRGTAEREPTELARQEAHPAVPLGLQRERPRVTALLSDGGDTVGPRRGQDRFDHAYEDDDGDERRDEEIDDDPVPEHARVVADAAHVDERERGGGRRHDGVRDAPSVVFDAKGLSPQGRHDEQREKRQRHPAGRHVRRRRARQPGGERRGIADPQDHVVGEQECPAAHRQPTMKLIDDVDAERRRRAPEAGGQEELPAHQRQRAEAEAHREVEPPSGAGQVAKPTRQNEERGAEKDGVEEQPKRAASDRGCPRRHRIIARREGHLGAPFGQPRITRSCRDSTERQADSTAPSIQAGSGLAPAHPM